MQQTILAVNSVSSPALAVFHLPRNMSIECPHSSAPDIPAELLVVQPDPAEIFVAPLSPAYKPQPAAAQTAASAQSRPNRNRNPAQQESRAHPFAGLPSSCTYAPISPLCSVNAGAAANTLCRSRLPPSQVTHRHSRLSLFIRNMIQVQSRLHICRPSHWCGGRYNAAVPPILSIAAQILEVNCLPSVPACTRKAHSRAARIRRECSQTPPLNEQRAVCQSSADPRVRIHAIVLRFTVLVAV